MHPRTFLDNFWRNDLANEVFVAMSFDPKYNVRWQEIFVPAIEGELFGGLSLKAVRVDVKRSGDSIITEITNGIAHAQLILADISVTDYWKEDEQSKWARNGNVLYEVGIAMACRQPVEVILIRDDEKPLLFDVSHIPVMRFDAENYDASINLIRNVFRDRLQERNLTKDLRFISILESLAQFEINLIRSNANQKNLGWKGPSYPPAVAISLPRLLEKRILRLVKLQEGDTPDIYTWTTFGRAIAEYLKSQSKENT